MAGMVRHIDGNRLSIAHKNYISRLKIRTISVLTEIAVSDGKNVFLQCRASICIITMKTNQ